MLYDAKYADIKAKHVYEAQKRTQREAATAATDRVRREEEQWKDLQMKRMEEVQKERKALVHVDLEIEKLRLQINSLEKVARESLIADRQGAGWWSYLTGWGQTAEDIEKEKIKREQETLQRLASERIKMARLQHELEAFKQSKNAQVKIMKESEVKFNVLEQNALHEKRRREEAARQRATDETAREEALRRKAAEEIAARMKEQLRRQQNELRARTKAAEAERKEAEKLAREKVEMEKGAAKQRLAAMKKRQAAAQAEKDKETASQQAQSQRRARGRTNSFYEFSGSDYWEQREPTHESSCIHSGFWPKVEGRNQCSVCSHFFNSFILRCPSCHRLACASCKKTISSRYR